MIYIYLIKMHEVIHCEWHLHISRDPCVSERVSPALLQCIFIFSIVNGRQIAIILLHFTLVLVIILALSFRQLQCIFVNMLMACSHDKAILLCALKMTQFAVVILYIQLALYKCQGTWSKMCFSGQNLNKKRKSSLEMIWKNICPCFLNAVAVENPYVLHQKRTLCFYR